MITIVLADDHHVVRQGLRALLQAETDFRIVGEAADGLEAVQQVERLAPEVLILDLMMPHLNGLEVTRQVRQRWPQIHVIILSMYANEAYVAEALKHGAAGYILKKSTANHLVNAVRQVITGRRYLSPPLSEEGVESYLQKARETAPDSYEHLTTREREVLHLVAEGLTSAEIAAKLVISPRTVEMHRANMMRKLELRNQAEVIRYALQRSLITLNNHT